MKEILKFVNEFKFLSNFWPVEIVFEDMSFPSVEHAYQASKTKDIDERKFIASLTAGQAKRAGRGVTLREDWEEIKFSIMEELVRQKFTSSFVLRKKLLATGDYIIKEGNSWGDRIWGVDIITGVGENNLGKIILKIREELKK